jgi:hypothetical protein
MQIKCQIKLSNDSVILVDPESLNFIENPDITSIPQISQDYCRECENIEHSQLEHILSPQSLSPLQEEMMSQHCRLHHMPFPKLITMAENGEIPKRLAVVQSVWRACLVKLTSAHGDPDQNRSIQFVSLLMMRQGRKHRSIRWYLLNLD